MMALKLRTTLDTAPSVGRSTDRVTYTFGSSGYIPVVGDWNGDGRIEIGTFVNGNSTWDGTPKDKAYHFGWSGYLPVLFGGFLANSLFFHLLFLVSNLVDVFKYLYLNTSR